MIVGRLGGDRRGVAAMEFGLIVPVAVIMMIGTYEVIDRVRANMKMNHALKSLSLILSAQGQTLTTTPVDMFADACAGAQMVLRPYDRMNLGATVGMLRNSTGTPPTSAEWQYRSACPVTGDPLTASTIAAAAGQLPNKGDSVLVVQGSYDYAARITYLMSSTMKMRGTAITRSRSNTPIACTKNGQAC